METLANSEIAPTTSQQRTSHFLTETKNVSLQRSGLRGSALVGQDPRITTRPLHLEQMRETITFHFPQETGGERHHGHGTGLTNAPSRRLFPALECHPRGCLHSRGSYRRSAPDRPNRR